MLTMCDGQTDWQRVIKVLPFSRSELGAKSQHCKKKPGYYRGWILPAPSFRTYFHYLTKAVARRLTSIHSQKRIMKPFAFAKPQNFRVFTKEYSPGEESPGILTSIYTGNMPMVKMNVPWSFPFYFIRGRALLWYRMISSVHACTPE